MNLKSSDANQTLKNIFCKHLIEVSYIPKLSHKLIFLLGNCNFSKHLFEKELWQYIAVILEK